MTDQIQTQQDPAAKQAFQVPEAYASKGWAKDIKSPDDLWKLTDNAQSLIGKRPAGIPSADAPDDEHQKFYGTLRPEKADAYKLPDVEGLPEGFDVAPYKQSAMSMFHEAGLSQKQAEKLWQTYLKTELGRAGENTVKAQEQQKALDAEFDAIVKEAFGEKYDASAKAAQELINAHTPETLRAAYGELADKPKAMAAVISALAGAKAEIDKIKAEYGAEGKITSGGQATAISIDEVRRELASLRTSKEAKDFTNPEYKKTMARIEELSAQVTRHYKNS